MITTNTGAKKLEASDNWREIFPNPTLSTAGAHNASVDAADRIQPEIAPIINGKQCALGAASGDYVLLRNSTITGKSDGAYIAAKAIPANTDIDSTYLGNAITGGISNSLNSNITSLNNSLAKKNKRAVFPLTFTNGERTNANLSLLTGENIKQVLSARCLGSSHAVIFSVMDNVTSSYILYLYCVNYSTFSGDLDIEFIYDVV